MLWCAASFAPDLLPSHAVAVRDQTRPPKMLQLCEQAHAQRKRVTMLTRQQAPASAAAWT